MTAPASTTPPLSPGAARRRELRQQRRAERLRQLWRIAVFSGLAAGLGWVLLRQGWMLRDPSQLEVRGSAIVNREQVIQTAELRFPLSLLGLDPRQLRQRLSAALPVERVSVSRLMLPPRLRVDLVDREAVARAERRLGNGTEQGYVDAWGNWMSVRQHLGVRTRGSLGLRVVGWNERHRQELRTVLAARDRLGPGLREIRFEPDGSLWLDTAALGRLRLGPSDERLGRRLEVAEHLMRTLPAQLAGGRPQQIDLSDPEQPELSMAGGATLPVGAGRAAATPGAD